MSATESIPRVAPANDAPLLVDETGMELKRGVFFNTIAMLASNLSGIFAFLVARLLGPVALGLLTVAWATTDLISKIGILGLDDAIITFIARAEAVGDRVHSRVLFRLAVGLAVVQSALVAVVSIVTIRMLGNRLPLEPKMVSALAIILCALPGVALYRIGTSVSRGMKVMKHDIYSRGITESVTTMLAFLLALAVGFDEFSPEVAVIVGSAASGMMALALASRLFRHLPKQTGTVSLRKEAGQLLAYGLPIGADQFLNAFIWRLDVIILGWFVGRAPGVTLTTLGVYGAATGIANGLRKISQSFNPIFTPVVAGMAATGNHKQAAETYARLAQWMLWILLPLVALMTLAAGTILLIFGPTFQQGSIWLGIVAIACATSAFINLGETVIMVQRPGLNLLNSLITCAAGGAATFWLIPRLGIMGGALGILLTYLVQGVLRAGILRFVFRWPNPWKSTRSPVFTAIVAIIPASICRLLLNGIAGQLTAAVAFLVLFGLGWWKYHVQSKN